MDSIKQIVNVRELADLPHTLAREIAYDLQYRDGDTVEIMPHPHEFTWKISNHANDRHTMLREDVLQMYLKKEGRGNKVFRRLAYFYLPKPTYMAYDMAGPTLSQAINEIANPAPIPPPPPPEERPRGTVLVLAGNKQEADEFARHIMGWKDHEWQYVSGYITVNTKRGASLYIVGTARDRPDFAAIEGLFLMNKIEVVDTNE